MKRRGLLKALAGLIAAPVAAKVKIEPELLKPDPPLVSPADVFISEFGDLRVDKLAQTGDTEKYLITSKATPDISKEFWISSAQLPIKSEDLAAEMAHQIDRRVDEMLKDVLMIQHGDNWREHYEAMMAKHEGANTHE